MPHTAGFLDAVASSRISKAMYFDYLATTPLDKRVAHEMAPFWAEAFGNPHSSDHAYGFEASQAVAKAQDRLNGLIPPKARGGRWVFTSGASEANNLAIKGAAEQALSSGNPRRRILVSAIEHACVLESARYLEGRGFSIEYLPVNNDGVLDLDEAGRKIGADVLLVSVMWANNEIGTIQPIGEVLELCHAHGVLFHSDAAQAAGKIPLELSSGAFPDLVSLSGHKMYGPKGIGVLYVAEGVALAAQIHGGGQQGGLRAGTVPVPLVVGLGEAARFAIEDMERDAARLARFRDGFERALKDAFPDLRVNGGEAPRLAQVSHFQIPDVDMGDLMTAMEDVAFSRGSACGSAKDQVSHVLAAMRMEFFAHECLRVSFGRMTTDEEAGEMTTRLIETAQALRDAQKKYA